MREAVTLGAAASAERYRLQEFDELDSTSSEAMRRARAGDAGRLWVSAARQKAGRGRLNRPWESPPGNFYASLLLVGEVVPARAAELGFVAGLALHEAISPALPLVRQTRLKWPNDLLIDGAKVAGILLEGSALSDGRFACVIGCGVNCASHPSGTSYPSTSLAAAGADLDAPHVMARLSDAFATWFLRWQEPNGFAAVREKWLANAYRLGRTIFVMRGEERIEGIFRAIDPSGRLVLVSGQMETVIETGDVMLPSAKIISTKAS